jgi:hypothetical protein
MMDLHGTPWPISRGPHHPKIRHELYRWYDGSATLLYVGRSYSAMARAAAHASGSSWYDDATIMIKQRYPSLAELVKAERQAIKTERPKYNVASVPGRKSTQRVKSSIPCPSDPFRLI